MTTINSTVTPVQRTNAIKGLRDKGDRYGHAAIAGLASEIARALDGDKLPAGVAVKLVKSTGYDKGTVSRVGKFVRTDKSKRAAALKFDVTVADSTPELFAAAVKLGLQFKRVTAVKVAAAATDETEGDETTSPTGTGEASSESDPITDLYDWLLSSTDEQYTARVALVEDVLERIAGERAALAAA